MATPRKAVSGAVAANRKAFNDYDVLDRFEAGLVLTGTEIKSVRAGHVTLTGGFVRLDEGQATLCDVHIAPYESGNRFNHDPTRPRRLLLRRQEAARLTAHLAQKGHALIPLKVYFAKRWAKVELGLCRGRADPDKREALRRKVADRETRRAIARQE